MERVGADAGARVALQRSVVIYVGLLLLSVAALVSAVGILNREIYSAPAFVRLYLDALARHDVTAALATPGVVLDTSDEPGEGAAALVSPDALGEIADIRLVSDTQLVEGRHRLVFSYTLSGRSGEQVVAGQSEFDVEKTGTSWLVFPQWAFVRSPTAQATVTVSHASTFTAGRTVVTAGPPEEFHAVGEYEVLVPSLTVLSHDSALLGAVPSKLAATKPLSAVGAIVEAKPKQVFLDAVQEAVDDFLDACAQEPLLYPPGCPFGFEVDDRIVSEPSWTMESYPALTILAGQDGWVVPNATGSARIAVDIRSLYDGTVTPRDQEVPFEVTFALTITPTGTIAFTPRS